MAVRALSLAVLWLATAASAEWCPELKPVDEGDCPKEELGELVDPRAKRTTDRPTPKKTTRRENERAARPTHDAAAARRTIRAAAVDRPRGRTTDDGTVSTSGPGPRLFSDAPRPKKTT